MGKIQSTCDGAAIKFIAEQPLFFVASAPLDAEGHINVSPQGLDSLRLLNPATVADLDLTGTGVDRIAPRKENGRSVIMFCAYQGRPNLVRRHGRGRVVEPQEAEFPERAGLFPAYEGTRSLVVVDLDRVSDSCGYAVPSMKFDRQRSQLVRWASKKGPEGLKTYRQQKKRPSLDGLPGLAE
jgi:hypothetical protein